MKLFFVTSSESKIAEVGAYLDHRAPKRGGPLAFRPVRYDLQEIMVPDLEDVVRYKALEAYRYLRQPCVVEHGGLFFDGLRDLPGPLGKLIWNAVGERMCGFLRETDSRRAVARAIIGYCDGRQITLFRGETEGEIAHGARGDYNRQTWDPIFIPEGSDRTYGELGALAKEATSPMLRALESCLSAVYGEGEGRARRPA